MSCRKLANAGTHRQASEMDQKEEFGKDLEVRCNGSRAIHLKFFWHRDCGWVMFSSYLVFSVFPKPFTTHGKETTRGQEDKICIKKKKKSGQRSLDFVS